MKYLSRLVVNKQDLSNYSKDYVIQSVIESENFIFSANNNNNNNNEIISYTNFPALSI